MGDGRGDPDRLLTGLLGERDRQFDDAVARRHLDLLGIGTPGQRHRAREGPVAAPAPNVVLFLILRALLMLARRARRTDPSASVF